MIRVRDLMLGLVTLKSRFNSEKKLTLEQKACSDCASCRKSKVLTCFTRRFLMGFCCFLFV